MKKKCVGAKKKELLNEVLLAQLTHELERQGAGFFREVADVETGLEVIAQDRESELEERAQEERIAGVLARLDDRGRRNLEETDAALNRIENGTYGSCENCGRRILPSRLQALPATRFCVKCAGTNPVKVPAASEELPRSGKVPADINLLSDRELELDVLEQVKEDGRFDVQELRVVCRHGVIYLAGMLPSEAEHRILHKIVTDILGLEVVDHIQVEELVWEREIRSKRETPEDQLPWEESRSTEDIVESTDRKSHA